MYVLVYRVLRRSTLRATSPSKWVLYIAKQKSLVHQSQSCSIRKRKEVGIGMPRWDSRSPQILVCCTYHSNAHHCCDVVECIQHMTGPLLGNSVSKLFHQQFSFIAKHSIHRDHKGSKVLLVLLASLEVLLLLFFLLSSKMVLGGAIHVGLCARVG
eukprot:10149847-Ditylum_brightwellii.AAC.1